jgi:hypothetical protein
MILPRDRLLRRLDRRERLGWLMIRAEAAWAQLPDPVQKLLRWPLHNLPGLRRSVRQPL